MYNEETKEYKVTLILDEHGNVTGVEPLDQAGKVLKPVKKHMGENWTSNGIIDNVTTLTILSKPGFSPCCIIVGSGDTYCWC
jgi:hypothetical protein